MMMITCSGSANRPKPVTWLCLLLRNLRRTHITPSGPDSLSVYLGKLEEPRSPCVHACVHDSGNSSSVTPPSPPHLLLTSECIHCLLTTAVPT